MKSIIFKGCSPLSHGMALQHLSTYMQDIGETKGSYPAKHYCHVKARYITKIRQTKTSIVIEALD